MKSSPQKLAYMRTYNARNRERNRIRDRAYRLTLHGRLMLRKSQIKTKYGLEWSAYLAFRKKQKNRCAICRKKTKLGIDHCHKTGRVRGLLCTRCNVAIGYLMNDPALAIRACAYLK